MSGMILVCFKLMVLTRGYIWSLKPTKSPSALFPCPGLLRPFPGVYFECHTWLFHDTVQQSNDFNQQNNRSGSSKGRGHVGFCLVFAVTCWPAKSKGLNDVGDVLSGQCFLGLVVAIVLELGCTAVAVKQSWPPCANRSIRKYWVGPKNRCWEKWDQLSLLWHLSKKWLKQTRGFMLRLGNPSLERIILAIMHRGDLTRHTVTPRAHTFPLVFSFYNDLCWLPSPLSPLRDPALPGYILIHGPTRFMWGDREEFTSNKSFFFLTSACYHWPLLFTP